MKRGEYLHFSFDRFQRWERPQLVLCELNKARMGVLNDITLSMNIRWTDISEVSFTVSSVLNGGRDCPLFNKVRELRLIEIPHFGWFQIRDVDEIDEGYRLVKQCVAYSAESMLKQKLITDLEGEFRLHDPITPSNGLMGKLLDFIPGWSIGNIDAALLARWRTLSIREQNLYALLTNDVAEAYECLFIFDYVNFRINIVDKTRQFRDTSISISHENLIKNSSVRAMTERIVTALHVRGGNLDIAGVNPNGTDVLYNVNYFKDRMSQGLLDALTAYEALFNSLQPTYANLLTQVRSLNQQLALLNNNPPQYDVFFDPTQNGTLTIAPSTITNVSGLNQLEALRSSLEGVRGARIENGNIPYSDVNAVINQLEPIITAKRSAITSVEGQIISVNNQLRNIVDQLKMDNNFTPAQWIELNRFFIFDTFQEDSLIWTDIMTNQERQDIQQELFDLGARKLQRSSYPKFEINIASVNFLALPEFQAFSGDFELGTTFTLNLGHYSVRPLLLEVFIDFENPTNFNLVYANKHTLDVDFSLVDFNTSSVNATNAISFDLVRLEAMKSQSDEVTAFMNGVLDASRNELISSPTRTAITINEFGLRAKSYDWVTGQPTGLQAWLTGSQLAFSDDGFQTSRLALGRVNFPGSAGGWAYGLVADVLAGRILAGNSLHIANEGNNFRLDETGAWLENATFTLFRIVGGVRREIVLDPMSGMRFRNGAQDVITMSIIDGSATFAGQITGGSININNQFMVDEDGNVTIRRGSISLGGTSTVPSFHVNNNGDVTISRGSISLGGTAATPNFHVNSDGVMTMRRGEIRLGGTAIRPQLILDNAGNIASGPLVATPMSSVSEHWNFHINSLGTLTARNGDFRGFVRAFGFFDGRNPGNDVNMMNQQFRFLPDYLELRGLSIINNLNVTTLSIDSNGNLITRGDIMGGSIRIGGTVAQPNFHVDSQGNVTIRQGEIRLGGTALDPNFLVDNQGNVTIRRGEIRIGGTVAQPNFHVDSSGNLTSINGNIFGANISWAGTPQNPLGRLYWGQLHETLGVIIQSNVGARIEATGGGLHMNASGGLWLGPSNVHFNVSGESWWQGAQFPSLRALFADVHDKIGDAVAVWG